MVINMKIGKLSALVLFLSIFVCSSFGQISGIDLKHYPLVSFYISSDATINCVKEDGVEVDFWFKTPDKAFISDMDIVIVLDSSGSMRNIIGIIDDLMKNTIRKLKEEGLRLRYSLVTFGDELRDLKGFTFNDDVLISWLRNVVPFGGGDDPEISLDALSAASDLPFDVKAKKVIMLITNAPAHSAGDEAAYSKVSIDGLIGKLNGKGLELLLLVPPEPEYVKISESLGGKIFNIFKIAGPSEAFEELANLNFRTRLVEFRTPNFDFNRSHSIEVFTGDKVLKASYISPERLNSPPIIDSFSAIPPIVYPGENVRLSIDAHDPDGDALSYNWKLNGKLLDATSTELLIAPEATGVYVMECHVNDGRLSNDSKVSFRVIDKPKPVIIKKTVEKIVKPQVQQQAAIDITELQERFGITIKAKLVEDIDGDGTKEIIAGTDAADKGFLYLFNEKGELLWKVKLSDDSVFWPDDSFEVTRIQIGDVNDDGLPEIVVVLNHVPWFPSILAVVSLEGIVEGRYYHPGHIKELYVNDLNGDGICEIVFAGENAEFDYKTVIGVMNGRKVFGQATPYYGLGQQKAEEIFYKIFEGAQGFQNLEIKDKTILFTDESGKKFVIENIW